MAKKNKTNNTLAENRKARHDYFIEESIESGIELVGTEVKSIRQGKANLKDSYAEINNGEVFMCNVHISPYEKGNIFNKDPLRKRKLLLHKVEIRKLEAYTSQKGYTLVPLSLYLKNGRVKVQLSVAKGKKDYDKRDTMLEKAAKREIDRQMKNSMR
ncbi:SsrA-binding protein [Clostridium pasteurianum DSM 525 = ATCC 6013]|uniref:SsrA-binding protein n=1 Tax=Clostridium pasteurianum DSM 525 = ATCC 6013 TaxID=1262449 RepID=A0A0H3JAV4_CLOPA|nr:SsrA-binding protein SmpB [Clostridium pasteurianum]AJA48880.1 SsrA-binding protein [Clostridium pasteurianum DSM 525 = ATCC 6013]AJA52868.1 SsrA-binding protein [Clostridium pasteurianum DSM 525 = ATCC 6013]AOZ76090.1 SsrA-binding protein [Clostridium pasteurianum DSM 525 = ATCC 6013]AOZ79886.1 SsrA-binding protein [Clostridium pasteurianum]ELP60176.1 SsrA-binding protein [Clostridium pasteurianum DSM 525 = ATCC 6013]